ncbi:MAG: methyltransferase [Rubritepida sp.]|jgi:tRNA1(Val) A37 N6-methylase TrmN6|nr:methyltransferase [Rubritepida sp.]
MPASEPLTEDKLLGGRVRLAQPRAGFRAAIDPVLLAAFVPARGGERVLEAGCGSGAAFLCLATRVPGLAVEAVERDTAMAALAARNARANGIVARITAADVRAMPAVPRCDHAFANPPFWPGGTASPQAARRDAAHEDAPLADWVTALARPLRRLGTLALVLPASRFAEAAGALRAAGCGAVTLLPLWPRAGVAAKRVLLRARRGGRGPDQLLPGLVLHEADGRFTAAAEAVLREGAALG